MDPPARFDEYEIVKPLGRGTAGHVFVARDLLLEREVAIKIVATKDPAALGREARAAARIQHPNVATLYRVGELGAGQAYLVWELVRGKSLEQLPRPVPADQVASIARDVTRGLAAAHRRGVLHRDLKPANIVLDDGGQAKLVDFGLAVLVDAPTEADEAALVGTPYFRAPELWRREPADPRTDLYALGVVLYELLAGEGPFRHLTRFELADAVMREEPRPLRVVAPTVPAALALLVDRLVRRDRDARFARADDVLAALELLGPGRAAGTAVAGNPYRGLRAYDAEHRSLFFGRTRPLQLALERLRGEAMLVVIGDSGVGKSSLCAAGIVPAIADGDLADGRRWLVGRMVPGRTPIRNLAAALAAIGTPSASELERVIAEAPHELGRKVRGVLRDEQGLVLYIDQMEELITLAPHAERSSMIEEAARVAEALGALADDLPGIRVLGTTRSDFLSRLSGLPALAERLPSSIMLLAPMQPEEIREAITGPATLKNTRFESDALVDQLVDSTLGAQGSLPLLQFTLAELWERREADVITAASLASVGGVAGALARHADEVLVALATEERAAARALMLRLVTIDDTRARRSDVELEAVSPLARKVLEAMVRGRLLVASESPDGTTYEIAHEALVRGWDTLARWLAEETERRAARHRLEVAATEWERLGRRRELVWSARQLAELDARVLDGLSPREDAFVAASRRARTSTRWMRRLAVAGVLLLIGGVWGGSQLVQRRRLARAIAADVAHAGEAKATAQVALTARANARREAFEAWDAQHPDKGETAWTEAQSHATAARKQLGLAATHFERALGRDVSRDDVRAAYADLLLERALLADDDGRAEEHDELVARLAIYDDDGTRRAKIAAGGQITIDVAGEVRLEATRYDGSERTPLVARAPHALGTGPWLVTATAPDRRPVVLPIFVGRGSARAISLALPAALPDDFVYMPAGDAMFGSADPEALRAWSNAVAAHVVQTSAFLIAKHETTFAAWIEYLEALPAGEREQRRPRVVSSGTGVRGALELVRTEAGTYRIALQPAELALAAGWNEPLHYPQRTHRATQDWRRFPVAGISFDDAVAYTKWLDATKRVPGARLCSEIEWERAARGTSIRRFPHGDVMRPDDANIDVTYGKLPASFGPDEVGSHLASTSPFGIDDLAGNVWEWTTGSVVSGQVVARGGSYYFAADTARITNRETPEASYRGSTVGFRVCASLPTP